jgi:hypothetical protein
MRRREFVTLVGVAAGGARAAARTVGDRVSQQRVTRRLCTNGCRASQPLYLPRPQPGGSGGMHRTPFAKNAQKQNNNDQQGAIPNSKL